MQNVGYVSLRVFGLGFGCTVRIKAPNKPNGSTPCYLADDCYTCSLIAAKGGRHGSKKAREPAEAKPATPQASSQP